MTFLLNNMDSKNKAVKDRQLCKPVAAIERLFKLTELEHAERFTLARNKTFPSHQETNQNFIYFLTEGRFAITRKHDGLYIASVTSPLVMGLSMLFQKVIYQKVEYTLFPETFCTGYKMTIEDAKVCIDRLGLWQDVAAVLAYSFELLMHRDRHFVGVNAYTMVRYSLLKIHEFSHTDRMHINVEQFIQQHTRLSRSRIMKILSDLRAGEYICMKRGRLLEINNLPEHY